MKLKLNLFLYLLTAFLFIAYGAANVKVGPLQLPAVSPTRAPTLSPALPQNGAVKVERIVDGDTIVLAGGQKLRYIGIDTPETVDPRRAVGCFGKEASNENKKLVAGKYVKLERDVSDTDKYGRLLRYVWVFDTPDATGSGIFVNEYLVKEGYARAATYPPDVKYADYFASLQDEARTENRGLWSACR